MEMERRKTVQDELIAAQGGIWDGRRAKNRICGSR
jgi:hypothetical protein